MSERNGVSIDFDLPSVTRYHTFASIPAGTYYVTNLTRPVLCQKVVKPEHGGLPKQFMGMTPNSGITFPELPGKIVHPVLVNIMVYELWYDAPSPEDYEDETND